MREIPKLFVDFNNTDNHGRVRLNTKGTVADIKKINLELKEGIQVFLDDEDGLKTFGYVEYSEDEKIWVARINWEA